jgi:hypothetical protein
MQALLTRQPTLASVAIRARLLEPWSHSMGVLSPTEVLDSTALHDGVRPRPMSQALAPATAVLSLHLPLPDEASGLAWARERIGTPYDWPAIWGFAIDKPDRQDPKRVYCHEFIAGWCRAGGLTDFDPLRLVKAKHLIRVAARIGQVRELRPVVSWG